MHISAYFPSASSLNNLSSGKSVEPDQLSLLEEAEVVQFLL
jgi:hypothetical protein